MISKKFNSTDIRNFTTFEINPHVKSGNSRLRANSPKSPITLEETSMLAFDVSG